MDPLELYAHARDGGSWLELAADSWRLLLVLGLIGVVTTLVLALSARSGSFVGRMFAAIRPPAVDHLFLRVSVRSLGPESLTKGDRQAYLAALHAHQISLYAHFPAEPGEVALIDPPGVRMVVTGLRKVSDEPPWFAIEAEPLFRDDGSKSKYRKFIGGISHVTYRYCVFPDLVPGTGALPFWLWPSPHWRPFSGRDYYHP